MSARILVVDDDKPIRSFVARNLTARGFEVLAAGTGLEALAIARREPLDLVILDVMMPNLDGYETCRRLRQLSTVPVIVLTALGEESDRVTALDNGADDCLTKPFGVEELLARVRAALRRVGWDQADTSAKGLLRYKDIELDVETRSVRCRNERVKLTPTEFNLLRYFMEHVGTTLPHRVILQGIWGAEYGEEAEYLRVYVGRLRRKLEADPSNPEYFVTEHGVGYRFGGPPPG